MKITSITQLNKLYDLPKMQMKQKRLDALEKHAINYIKNAPFVIVSTFDKMEKMDTSPRGGNIGFVKVINNNTIVIPDSKGNNRIDSLVNIVETERIATLFLIPGIEETLRVNGSAIVSTDEKYLHLFTSETKTPKSCIVITVEEVFLHCAKALLKSKLWLDTNKIKKANFATIEEMLKN